MNIRLRFPLLALTTLLPAIATAQVPGTIETFTEQAVAATWRVYDYEDGLLYPPRWVDEANPHIDYGFRGGQAFWFVAGTGASGGKLTGDLSVGIDGVAFDVRIDNLAGFDWLDVLILSTTDGRYYQSSALFEEDFGGNGWWTVTISFDETWFWFNNGNFEPVDLRSGPLLAVSEVGFRVAPKAGNLAPDRIGCDDFRLVPILVPPAWTVADAGDGFALQLLPGHGYTVERTTDFAAWLPWQAYTNLTGGGTLTIPIPTEPGPRAYRLIASPQYSE
jgi:hypothetical protein